jgi:hypothetical protein
MLLQADQPEFLAVDANCGLSCTLAVLADPKGEVERMAATYGYVCRSRVLGETSISVLGRLFPHGLMLLDFDEHWLHRRARSVAFKSGPKKSYLSG